MFGSQILDVAIGLILVFLLVSVICSAVREGLEAWLKTRASFLEHGIRSLLHDHDGSGIASKIYDHPLVEGLFAGKYSAGNKTTWPSYFGGNLPSYIPSKNFAEALLDIAARGSKLTTETAGPNAEPLSVETIRANIANVDNLRIQRVLLSALDSSKGDLERVKKSIEEWYDSGMDRVSGWYKRSTQWIIFVIALFLAIGFNINAIAIAEFLYQNESVREALVVKAGKIAETGVSTDEDPIDQIKSLDLPIGWTKDPQDAQPRRNFFWSMATPVLGWLLVAFAASMGAPFWFDLLNKFMVIRSTVKPHEKSPEESSEDRQQQIVVKTT